MAHGYPLNWDGRVVHSSEALYQALKFPRDLKVDGHSPFELVIREPNAFLSKRIAQRYTHHTIPEWHDIKLDVMNYCIRLKYLQHRDEIDIVLDHTEDRPIVEKSRRDNLWGAVNDYKGNLVGENLLGELWMMIRSERPNIVLPKLPIS